MTEEVATYSDSVFSDWSQLLSLGDSATSDPTLYEELRADVQELLDEFATGSFSIYHASRVPTDDTLQQFDVTESAYPVDAAIFGFSAKLVDGARILSDDLRVLVAGADLDFTPTTNDTVAIDGVRHAIVSVTSIPAAGLAVAYAMQARRQSVG